MPDYAPLDDYSTVMPGPLPSTVQPAVPTPRGLPPMPERSMGGLEALGVAAMTAADVAGAIAGKPTNLVGGAREWGEPPEEPQPAAPSMAGCPA